VDPFTAFAAAQAAIKGVQAAIKMGKDIQGIMHDVIGFMDAKDAVVTAKGQNAKSDTGRALEIAMHAKTLADQEQELKELLIYSGNGDVWEMMLHERSKIRQKRKANEIALEKKRKKNKQDLEDIATVTFWSLLIVTIGGTMLWGIIEYLTWGR